MSKNTRAQPIAQKVITKKTALHKEVKKERNKIITIPFPYLWLAIAVILTYIPSFSLGFTELDDSIFIREFSGYNQDLHNLITSFHRGLFDPVNDPYYRPLFMDSIILNFQMFGQKALGYHVFNILFHIGAVMLLYRLFHKLGLRSLHAFIFTLIFAVHPVLAQAVAWIPGRNDTMLAIFIFAFLINVINYSRNGKILSLLLSVLFLLLAYFTKETAVFAAPVALVLLTLYLGNRLFEKRNLVQYAAWVVCFAIWFWVRSTATIAHGKINPGEIGQDFIYHLPVVVQYLGKIVLPFNLSVFPTIRDTVYWYGIAAIIILALLIFTAKEKNFKTILGAFAVFFIFLFPVLLVPESLDNQVYEHRLYLPIVGILLLLPQIDFYRSTVDGTMLMLSLLLCLLLAVSNIRHQKNFNDPVSFWQQAVETSPNSAYANKMLAARTDNVSEAAELFRKAYQLNPNERYVNYYMGEMLQKEDSIMASEKYLLNEKKISKYYKCDFLLAKVAFMKRDTIGAINYLQNYLAVDSLDVPANFNMFIFYMQTRQPELGMKQAEVCERRYLLRLSKVSQPDKLTNSDLLLIYFQTHQVDKAKAQLNKMRQQGIEVPNEFIPQAIVNQLSM